MNMELRPQVQAFAEMMEARLRQFDQQRGPQSWREGTDRERSDRRWELLERAQNNIDDLQHAIATLAIFGGNSVAVLESGVDAANFLMMALDLCGIGAKWPDIRDNT